MTKYRKKPVEIEAMQWDGTAKGAIPIIDWVLSGDGIAHYRCDGPGGCPGTEHAHYLVIRTLEGDMRAECGDWVICGVQGEFYPCKPDIFEATYEPVGSASTFEWADLHGDPATESRHERRDTRVKKRL